jgi:long-chain acyl-CoA synthetase
LLDEYYKKPEANEAIFRDGYFTVGDMALQDEEGYYYIVDRREGMLISGDVNIYPRESEGKANARLYCIKYVTEPPIRFI